MAAPVGTLNQGCGSGPGCCSLAEASRGLRSNRLCCPRGQPLSPDEHRAEPPAQSSERAGETAHEEVERVESAWQAESTLGLRGAVPVAWCCDDLLGFVGFFLEVGVQLPLT